MGRAAPDRLATGPALNRADAQTDLKTEAAMSCSCKWLILVREVCPHALFELVNRHEFVVNPAGRS